MVYADDSFLMREAMRHLLEQAERVRMVATVEDGTALWDAVVEHRPDVVIADMRMPPSGDDEGVRIAERLRREHPAVGLVVLTQVDDPARAKALLQNGAEGRGFVMKERVHDLAELVSTIELVAAGGTAIDPAVVRRLIAGTEAERPSALSSLTPRERDVLALMARGLSNTAIASELVMTRRGVEKHVGAIFAKLGLDDETVTSRRVMAVLRYLEAAAS